MGAIPTTPLLEQPLREFGEDRLENAIPQQPLFARSIWLTGVEFSSLQHVTFPAVRDGSHGSRREGAHQKLRTFEKRCASSKKSSGFSKMRTFEKSAHLRTTVRTFEPGHGPGPGAVDPGAPGQPRASASVGLS
jgi:hypothetical protein